MSKSAHSGTVAYIIVCWNNKDLIDECIESIRSQDYNQKKIIMVDNDSKDETVAYVRQRYKDVEVLPQSKNYGFAKGNNIGIKHALKDASVEYLVLLNSDARIKKDWTSVLTDFAKVRPKTATLQTITLDYYNHEIIDSTHIYISRSGQGTQGSYRRPTAEGLDVLPLKTFGCNAAAAMITRKFIEAQPFKNFFDETMFMYLEDVDIATRAIVMGWDNYIVPGSRAYHMGSASSGKNPGFSLYMTYRNNSRLLFTNLPLLMFIKIIPSVLRGDRATIRQLRALDKDDAAQKIVRGRLRGIVKLPLAIPKAIRMKLVRKISSRDLWKLMDKGF